MKKVEDMELDRITIQDQNGEEKVAEILKVVTVGDNKYAVYTFDPDAENVDLYASLIVEQDGNISFRPVATEADWNEIKADISRLSM